MLSNHVINFENVWKKYSRQAVLNNSLREEIVSIITGRKHREELAEGEFWALKNVSFKVNKGECLGLYGPNGSGKSTILKLLANITYPAKGCVRVKGRVAPLIELGAGMHPDLTGHENIFMNGAILGMSINEIKKNLARIIEFSGVEPFMNTPVKKYSSGMYLRLAFSIAIHSPSDIFLLDEVFAVGDQQFQEKCEERVRNLLDKGKTIVMVNHDLERLREFSNVVLMNDGNCFQIKEF